MGSVELNREVERLRNSCIACGRCTKVCPSFKHGGFDPMEIMVGGSADMSLCICCGTCSQICRRTDPLKVMMDLIAIERGLHPSERFESTGFIMPLPEDPPEPVWTGDDVKVMPGCVAKCKIPYVVYAASSTLKSMGFAASELEGSTCCLHPAQFRDMAESERRSYRVRMKDRAGESELITLCAGCSSEFNDSGIEAGHIIRFLAKHMDRLPRFEEPLKVGMEPGCSAAPFADEMRRVLEAMNCVVVNKGFGCCGKSTPVAAPLMDEREKECDGAEWIVVGCPMCQVKYDQHGGIPSMHISELVAMAFGDEKSLEYHQNRA